MRGVKEDLHPFSTAFRSPLADRSSYTLGFQLRDIHSLGIVGTPLQHDGCVNVLKWKRDGSRIITGSDDRTGISLGGTDICDCHGWLQQ
jgi:hypothetical protein